MNKLFINIIDCILATVSMLGFAGCEHNDGTEIDEEQNFEDTLTSCRNLYNEDFIFFQHNQASVSCGCLQIPRQ